MKKILYFPVAKEFYFALFLFAGAFKQVSTGSSFLDLSMLGLLLSATLVLIEFINEPKINKNIIQPVGIYILLAILILLSLFYSSSHLYGLDKAVRFISFTAWAFIGPFFMFKKERDIEKFIFYSILISVIMSCYAIKDLKSLLGNTYIGFVSVNGGNYLSLGRVSAMGILLILLFYIISNKNLMIKMMAFIGIILNFVALFASGSRMPLVALVCMLIYMAMSSIKIKKKIYVRKGFNMFFIVILLSVCVLGTLAKAGVFDTMIYRFQVLLTDSGGGESAEGRTDRYDFAFKLFADNPIVGDGIGGFGYSYNDTDARGYPHNIFLEIISELGLLGLILFLLLIFKCIVPYFYRGGKDNSIGYSIFIVFLFYFLNANISGDLNDNRVMFCFMSLVYVSSCITRVPDRNLRKLTVRHDLGFKNLNEN
ncbi:O-antigen ligase family protein [Bacillus sp. DX4.1]|uniref:O-antigen ligase family protein n=1 Tax=Bacillus sp. DX4.1 TaxID=3055867 RepID=UPI0025A07F21|nr:O-antigen ligase family protein [Bacillus sp. DX4.1]MDM5190879.1 O-antigen ligase family protein [Bacillus sp. DX4.1]